MRNIIDFSTVTNEEFDEIYTLTCDIMQDPLKYSKALENKIMASLFFEPSTRTSLSFTTAMYRLGGKVIGFNDANATSATKGESLKDTISIVSKYADIVVMRNADEGSALAGSMYSDVPFINAGDGGHLHPTQTLTDLVTIKKYRGSLDNMTVGICGDLKYGRTVHSLIKSLAKYENIKFVLISPVELQIPKYIMDFIVENKLDYEMVTDLEENIGKLDILYMTRIQKERFDDFALYERLRYIYILDEKRLARAKKDMLVLHPLPRLDEIADEVDFDPRAVYFKQAECGMYARMALILTLLKVNEKQPPKIVKSINTDKKCVNPKCITRLEKYLPILNDKICGYCEKEML
ncbi:MAG: aspartate carbamoyltransferase [Clostridia bacterium]